MARSAPRHKPMPRIAPRHEAQGAKENYGQGRGGRPWRRKRAAVMKRDGYVCQPCKQQNRVTLATEVDHVIPQAEGGTDDESNLQAICETCHKAKTAAEAARGVGRKSAHPSSDTGRSGLFLHSQIRNPSF